MSTFAAVGAVLALLTLLPLAWKWELGLLRATLGLLVLACCSTAIVFGLDRVIGLSAFAEMLLVWGLTIAFAVGVLAYRFYRDPERTPPGRDDAIVSPADGEVVYVMESVAGRLPVATKEQHQYTLEELTKTPLHAADATVVGIAMSFLDVHVNRAPIEGKVTLLRHFPGRFGSLRNPDMVFENERATTVIDDGSLQVAVVQIASRLVRQIASFVHEGHHVTLGQRIGVIRLGSQVDVVLPARPDLSVTVRPGDRVRAGESILAVFEATTHS